jgi:hypothetical protein
MVVDGYWIYPSCHCIFNATPVRGASQRGKRGGATGRGVIGTGIHELPSFKNLTTVARPYISLSRIIRQKV